MTTQNQGKSEEKTDQQPSLQPSSNPQLENQPNYDPNQYNHQQQYSNQPYYPPQQQFNYPSYPNQPYYYPNGPQGYPQQGNMYVNNGQQPVQSFTQQQQLHQPYASVGISPDSTTPQDKDEYDGADVLSLKGEIWLSVLSKIMFLIPPIVLCILCVIVTIFFILVGAIVISQGGLIFFPFLGLPMVIVLLLAATIPLIAFCVFVYQVDVIVDRNEKVVKISKKRLIFCMTPNTVTIPFDSIADIYAKYSSRVRIGFIFAGNVIIRLKTGGEVEANGVQLMVDAEKDAATIKKAVGIKK